MHTDSTSTSSFNSYCKIIPHLQTNTANAPSQRYQHHRIGQCTCPSLHHKFTTPRLVISCARMGFARVKCIRATIFEICSFYPASAANCLKYAYISGQPDMSPATVNRGISAKYSSTRQIAVTVQVIFHCRVRLPARAQELLPPSASPIPLNFPTGHVTIPSG
jgi:hypothetical protein